ncbi:relA-associated inhibitor isoform X1 [Oncorhynchus tshawytscha]|uniref:SH3 domain-containing protein n=2 Tax=Oncorhynchus tshawytscha TaxID=74940 RepID=A0AAZ3QML0_ONCTS|nr:relA-associated inhibitor isoform X1 [Oncorhynchus tshawytscha]
MALREVGYHHHSAAMSSQNRYASSMFQTMDEDLNASLAQADELSREFTSLLQEVSPSTQSVSQTTSDAVIPREMPQPSTSERQTGGGSSSLPYSPISTLPYSPSSSSLPYSPSSSSTLPYSPSSISLPYSPISSSTLPYSPSSNLDSMFSSSKVMPSSYGQLTPPNQSPRTQRRASPSPSRRMTYDRSPRGSISYIDSNHSPPSPAPGYDQSHRGRVQPSHSNLLSPYDSATMGRTSPRLGRSHSPCKFSQPAAPSTLPRNFVTFSQSDEGMQRPKNQGKWNETDLDVASHKKKPHHSYDKTEWLRPLVPNTNWRESNLDGPSPSKKDTLPRSHQSTHSSLPRNTRITVPPDSSSLYHAPSQPIISRISIPPCSSSSQPPRQHRPIPLSVIMRLQNPYWASSALHPRALGTERDMGLYRNAVPREYRDYLEYREYQTQPQTQPQTHELRQPAFHGEVLKPGDVDIELERLDQIHQSPMAPDPALPEKGRETERGGGGGERQAVAPRPLSPSRLQPVVAAESPDVPDMEELLRIRSEIPRALKRRGSVTPNSNLDPNPEPGSQAPVQPQKKPATLQPDHNHKQYKQIMNKLFRRKGLTGQQGGEMGSDYSSSSDGEGDSSTSLSPVTNPVPNTGPNTGPNIGPALPEYRGYNSILRRASRERGDSGQRARLSPLVLLLDGSLVGELDTVQRAVQEMNDPSQPNDEGITALHNAICGGHYSVVDFLVRIGANVSAPDSHGWTPLHCAASCNDLPLCQFLVRNGAAVMAVTESDDATASQKCDPYAMGFEECESFLRGVEVAMGVENSGVLYALWEYPAQETDELGFREGDMVTILQKPDGVDWWWASLCGREGFVPNNYFGLFPKVRPKSLC